MHRELGGRIEHHLHVLVEDIGARPPGSPANRRATTYVREVLEAGGLEVVEHPFRTRWWEPGEGGRLETRSGTIDVQSNPYSPAGDVRGQITDVDRAEALEELSTAAGEILALRGQLAREQWFPAAFPFLDLPEHRRLRELLQRLSPAAVIAISDHWQPIFEDPDLPFPSTTISTQQGVGVRGGEVVRLRLGGAVHEGDGATVAARNVAGGRRTVLSAHLDSKATTPGAFDNAASVATLLAMAETGAIGSQPLEIVLFNGEDHFDACGELAWLAATDLDDVAANVNVDGIGLSGQGTSLAMLACPDSVEAEVGAWVARRDGWTRAAPWFESDHAIFAMHGIPALAITSEDVHALMGGLAHTPADDLDVVDLSVLEDVAAGLPHLLLLLGATLDSKRMPGTGGLP
jgi:aminopeptidase YwaD